MVEALVRAAEGGRSAAGPLPPEILLPLSGGPDAGGDLVTLLLSDKRSPATRRAYRGDLIHFFGGEPDRRTVAEFCAASRPILAVRLAAYKAEMIAAGLAEATVNRRLSAVRSLLKLAHRVGCAQSDGRGLVDNERETPYRDTRGIPLPLLKKLVALPLVTDNRQPSSRGGPSPKALRDHALLRLLAENGLRRAEVCALDVDDFRYGERRLFILGKGKGSQKTPVTVSQACCEAISKYLMTAGHVREGGALFRTLTHRPEFRGHRLQPGGLYLIVRDYGAQLDVPKLSPHRIRHSCITAALEATGGDVRKVQRLSRHASLDVLLKYDDHRRDGAGEVTEILSGLLAE